MALHLSEGAPFSEMGGGTVPPHKNWRVYTCFWIFRTLHLSEGHHIQRDGEDGAPTQELERAYLLLHLYDKI